MSTQQVSPNIPSLSWRTFTGTLTSTSGGDAIPTYAVASIARYATVNNICFYEVYYSNTSGGTAGSGAGQLRLALPVACATNSVGNLSVKSVGSWLNSTTHAMLFGRIQSGASILELNKITIATGIYADFTPADQNNAARSLYINGWYEIA